MATVGSEAHVVTNIDHESLDNGTRIELIHAFGVAKKASDEKEAEKSADEVVVVDERVIVNGDDSEVEGTEENEEVLEELTVPVLKERLRAKGLKVGGRKAELIDRLLGRDE